MGGSLASTGSRSSGPSFDAQPEQRTFCVSFQSIRPSFRAPALAGTGARAPDPAAAYSTVTLFARFRGWSTWQPRSTAM